MTTQREVSIATREAGERYRVAPFAYKKTKDSHRVKQDRFGETRKRRCGWRATDILITEHEQLLRCLGCP